MPEQEGCALGRASRRKRERRSGLLPRLSRISDGQLCEVPPLSGPLPGWEKISACLMELILPSLPEDAGIREWRLGISLAASAWNLALLPEPVRDQAIERMVQRMEAEAMEDPLFLEAQLQRLILRKLRLYPGDLRPVLSWEVRKAGSEVQVKAIAALPPLREDAADESEPGLAPEP